MGANGVAALAEVQTNIPQLANSLAEAHKRIDALTTKLHELEHWPIEQARQGVGYLKAALNADYEISTDTWRVGRLEKLERFYFAQQSFAGRLRWLFLGR